MDLLEFIPQVPDFPKPGIVFRDISPLLAHPEAFRQAIRQLNTLADRFEYTHILGIESRGFIFGSALAYAADKGLILARKPNKLPLASHRESYGLEYGHDALEIQAATLPGEATVLLLDDVLATGGTLIAAHKLLTKAGYRVVGAMTLLEITGLNGAGLLEQHGIANRALLKV